VICKGATEVLLTSYVCNFGHVACMYSVLTITLGAGQQALNSKLMVANTAIDVNIFVWYDFMLYILFLMFLYYFK